MVILGQRMMLTCELAEISENGDRKVVLGIFLTHICVPISQHGQATLPQAFRLCEPEKMENVETNLEKVIK